LSSLANKVGVFLPERSDDCAGQGGEIDHELGLEMLVDVVEHIREHERPSASVLMISIVAPTSWFDIARTLRPAVGHVLHDSDRADSIDFRLACRERMHEPDNAGCARHVALHVLHAGSPAVEMPPVSKQTPLPMKAGGATPPLAAVPAHA
jgi:hypothetical protein